MARRPKKFRRGALLRLVLDARNDQSITKKQSKLMVRMIDRGPGRRRRVMPAVWAFIEFRMDAERAAGVDLGFDWASVWDWIWEHREEIIQFILMLFAL